MNNCKKPLWVKFIGAPGDTKTLCLENLTRKKDHKELRCADGKGDFYDRVKKLAVTSVNYYTPVTTDLMMTPSEIFPRLDQAFESVKLGIQNMTMNAYDKNFDVIVEAQTLDELMLYALTYRARNVVTDFTMNLLMKKFYECRAIIKKLQHHTLVIYLGDQPSVSHIRLCHKYIQPKENMVDTNFISTYYSIMLADFINRSEEKLIVQTGATESYRLQYTFLKKILDMTDTADAMELGYSPASPIYLSSNGDIEIQIVNETKEEELQNKKRKAE